MRIITFGRTVVVPVSLVVLALAGFSAPPVALRSMLVLAAVGALGFVMLALTRWWHRSRHVRPLTRMDDVLQIAKDDASDLARMGSDAG
jgi:nitrate/nitrite-specific signal transduction histidine kinase